jgi:DtxR family Mn-dependent transcriptional regulator
LSTSTHDIHEKALYESGEDYLETILILQKEKGSVRSVDIARELNYSRPSVSRAMGVLEKSGFIIKKEDNEIVLTKEGLARAKGIYERHIYLTKFLSMTAGVSSHLAEKDACRIEHILSPGTFIGIKNYVKAHEKEAGKSE